MDVEDGWALCHSFDGTEDEDQVFEVLNLLLRSASRKNWNLNDAIYLKLQKNWEIFAAKMVVWIEVLNHVVRNKYNQIHVEALNSTQDSKCIIIYKIFCLNPNFFAAFNWK